MAGLRWQQPYEVGPTIGWCGVFCSLVVQFSFSCPSIKDMSEAQTTQALFTYRKCTFFSLKHEAAIFETGGAKFLCFSTEQLLTKTFFGWFGPLLLISGTLYLRLAVFHSGKLLLWPKIRLLLKVSVFLAAQDLIQSILLMVRIKLGPYIA